MKLHYRLHGEGQPIILLHGLFGSGDNLGITARELAANGYQVYSLDLRNHGQSPHSDDMDFSHMAADVLEFIEDHNLAPLPILGHSLGGKVAMLAALKQPSWFTKIIAEDVAPVTYEETHHGILDGLKIVDQTQIQNRKQADDILADHVSHAGVRSFLLKNLMRTEDGLYALRLNLTALLNNYTEILAGVDGEPTATPTLFIKGENSNYILPEHRAKILRLFPKAELKTIEDAGHWIHAEKPNEFNQMVLNFLQ